MIGEKVKIHIVDDDEMLSEMLSDYLESRGDFNIETFGTGELCLEELKRSDEDPKIIILDFNLDSIQPQAANGLEILKAIKKYNTNIIVIMYSSQEQYGKALQTIGKGALEYVIKDQQAFSKIDSTIKNILK
jgi:two-component system, OmpR family, response regulator